MAVTELDSFVAKFKSLWASGHKAKLIVDSGNDGNLWVNLQVGLRCPQPQHRGHHVGAADQVHGKSNARQRRKIRRLATRSDTATKDVAAAGAVEKTANADASVQEDVIEEPLDNVEKENEDLEEENKSLKQKVKELEEELETVYTTKAVDNMMADSFKERMIDKYGYSSNDTESDYESDEEIRERNREKSRENKRLKKALKNKCDQCDFAGKTEAGLKGHITKKHKQ